MTFRHLAPAGRSVLHLPLRVMAESSLFQVRREPVCHYRVCVPFKRLVIVSVNRAAELTILASDIDCVPWVLERFRGRG
jgi:hypothetical protein